MLSKTQMMLAAALMAVVASTPAWAQGTDAKPGVTGDRLTETLRLMQEEIEKLRNDNSSMKTQIDDLRAKSDADWLTEARADQIRQLVQETLDDADSRTSLLNDGIMAGWNEHFFLADAFGRFLLQIEGLMQIRFLYNYRGAIGGVPDRHRSGFENTRTQLTFHGFVYSQDLEYLVRADFARAGGAATLLDAWVRYHLDNNWNVRVGQFKLPFTREELVSQSEQLAAESSEVNEGLGVGRSQGAELNYHDSANAFSIAASDGMSARGPALGGLMGGPRTNTVALTGDVEWAVTTRYERLLAGTWDQFGDFTSPVDEEFGMLLGLAFHAQQNESPGVPFIGLNEARSVGVTADFSVEWGGANAFVVATYHYLDTPTAQIFDVLGIVAQAGVYVAPKWEVFARAEWAQIENRSGGGFNGPDFGMGTIGFNYYIEGHDVKWTTDMGFIFTPVSPTWVVSNADGDITGVRSLNKAGIPELVFRTQLQLQF